MSELIEYEKNTGRIMTISEIQEIISRGENTTVEFKTKISQPWILTRNISAFANTKGGKILVGVDERRGIVGCDRKQLQRMFEIAQRDINGKVDLALEFVNVNGNNIGVIFVSRSKGIISSKDGVFIRVGAATQVMSSLEIQNRILPEEKPIDKLTELVNEQTNRIKDLQEEIWRGNSWKSKVLDYLLGGVVGAVIGFFLTLLLT